MVYFDFLLFGESLLFVFAMLKLMIHIVTGQTKKILIHTPHTTNTNTTININLRSTF